MFGNEISAKSRERAAKAAQRMYRVFIIVEARMIKDGSIIPQAIYWAGKRRELNGPPTEIRLWGSQMEEGPVLRYTCQIGGKQRYLYMVADAKYRYVLRWYVESPVLEPESKTK
ncbi:MAG: hypothetical protein FWC73_05170 [Defluviitaleaceae bacterium]|nr:hypothetical protein [Defluviitaleaceae bacterium]